MVKLETIHSPAQLQLLASEWDPFLEQSSTHSIFQSWDYLQCWLETFGSDFQLHVLVARDSQGSLLGIAPLMTGPGHRSLRRFVRHLAFVGQLCESLPEYCDFILRPGAEDEVMEAFYAHITGDLAPEWDVLYLPLLPADSPGFARLHQFLSRDGIQPKTIHSQSAHFSTLPATWEAYLASRSGNFRDKLRKATNRLQRDHQISVARAGQDISLEDAMPLLKELILERWTGQSEAFATERFDLFHQRLAQRLHAQGQLTLWFLMVDGNAVAAEYDFIDRHRRRAYGFQSGWRQEFAKFSVGKILQARCLEFFIQQGVREYDFMSGHGEYKSSWCTGERQVLDLEVPNPASLRGKVFGLARRMREARSALGKPKAA